MNVTTETFKDSGVLAKFMESAEFATWFKSFKNKQSEEDDNIVRRTFGFQLEQKSINAEERTCEFICSTEAIDSYDEIVTQDWEKRLDRYRANPVVLYHHNRAAFFDKAEDSLPIGYALDIKVITRDGQKKLWAKLKFVTSEANPLAERIWQGILQLSLRAVSVGFRPHSYKWEKINDVDQLVLSDNELYEISVVPMGANPDAVALSAGQKTQRERLIQLAQENHEMNITEEEAKRLREKATDATNQLAAVQAEKTATEARLKELEQKAAAAEAENLRLAEAHQEARAREI
jgi:HK97 family phage prohead protease